MDWSYVAGFFDGEGCVRHQAAHQSSQCTMVQSTHQDTVLHEIRKFLTNEGITCNTYTGKMNYITRGRRMSHMRTISVGESKSLIAFLEHIIPHLIVKKDKAIEALNRAREIQTRKDERAQKLSECLSMYERGASLRELQDRFNMGPDQIKKNLKQHGIKIRDLAAASRNRWSKHHSLPKRGTTLVS